MQWNWVENCRNKVSSESFAQNNLQLKLISVQTWDMLIYTHYVRRCCCCIFRVKMMVVAWFWIGSSISFSFFHGLNNCRRNVLGNEPTAWLPPKIPLFSCAAAAQSSQCTEISQLRYQSEDYFCGFFSNFKDEWSIFVGDPMWYEIKFVFTHDKTLNDAIHFEVDDDPSLS